MVAILLMDDDDAFASVLSETLEHAGHDVTVARSATEAIQVIQAKTFDILLTDLIVYDGKRPVPDGGISLITKLRGPGNRKFDPWVRDMPIIAISGTIHNPGMSDILKTAKALGADFALGKPTDTRDLLHAIDTLTKRMKRRN